MPDADEANENLLILQRKFFGSVGFPARLWKPKTDKQFLLEKLILFFYGNMGKSGKF